MDFWRCRRQPLCAKRIAKTSLTTAGYRLCACGKTASIRLFKPQQEFNTSMLLITHDMGVIAESCDTVGVMYAGEIVEYGRVQDIFEHTGHPYTRGLFGAIPRLNQDVRRLAAINGLMPDPMDLPAGCKFHPRCPCATEECKKNLPALEEMSAGHFVRCHNIRMLPTFSAEEYAE